MSVYKELGYAVRNAEKRQVQIWNDAADVGIVIDSPHDPKIAELKACFEMYKPTPYGGGWQREVTADGVTMRYEGDECEVLEAGFSHVKVTFYRFTQRDKARNNLMVSSAYGFVSVHSWTSAAAKQKARAVDY